MTMLFILAAAAGLRAGEPLGLEVHHFDGTASGSSSAFGEAMLRRQRRETFIASLTSTGCGDTAFRVHRLLDGRIHLLLHE